MKFMTVDKAGYWVEIEGIDMNDLDGEMGWSAEPVSWPASFSAKAWGLIRFLEDDAALFLYMDKFVITYEDGYLTDYSENGHEVGGPRATFDTMKEVEAWLEQGVDDNREKGGVIIPY